MFLLKIFQVFSKGKTLPSATIHRGWWEPGSSSLCPYLTLLPFLLSPTECLSPALLGGMLLSNSTTLLCALSQTQPRLGSNSSSSLKHHFAIESSFSSLLSPAHPSPSVHPQLHHAYCVSHLYFREWPVTTMRGILIWFGH